MTHLEIKVESLKLMLMMVRRTHVSMFWLEGESKTHHLTAYDPNDSN